MATNSSTMDPLDGGILDGLNSTSSNSTLRSETWVQALQDIDFLLLEAKLVFSAAGIIYVGAHAALRRPPSAALPKEKKARRKAEEEDKLAAQGLEMSDAILFPIMAGIVLTGLYYLIQYLNDPAIISKVLRWYMSIVSVASLITLYAHGVDLAAAFVFPKYWRGWDGKLRMADQKKQAIVQCDDVGNVNDGTAASSVSPLPGIFSWLTPTAKLKKMAWNIRSTFKREWLLRFFLQGMGEEKAYIKFATMTSLPLAAATAALYFTTTSPFLSNMLGYGMCYCSFLVLSPTDLLIGSLVLWGLFFYDIFMVFYTPFMVTVATTLDVPIKLQFKTAQRQSILGLGDIVIPGMFIAWALRADLWLHYKRLVKYESTDLQIVEKDASSGEIVTRSETKHREVKPPYVEVKGNWGDWFWTRRFMYLCAPRDIPPSVAASNFKKTYFYASMVGYLLGMLATLAMLLVFKRGQPALLYLVPGVLGCTYATAIARGELKALWKYTEDGSLDTVDVVVDLDGDGNAIKTIGKIENGVVDTTKKDDKNSAEAKADSDAKGDGKGKEKGDKKADEEKKEKNHHVFLFSLEAPPEDKEA